MLGPTIRDTTFHTANLISQEVKKEMNDIKQEVLNVEGKILQAVATNNAMIQDFASNEQMYQQELVQADMINNAAQYNHDIMKLMQNLQNDLNQVK